MVVYMRTTLFEDEEQNYCLLVYDYRSKTYIDYSGKHKVTQVIINMCLRHGEIVRIGEL